MWIASVDATDNVFTMHPMRFSASQKELDQVLELVRHSTGEEKYSPNLACIRFESVDKENIRVSGSNGISTMHRLMKAAVEIPGVLLVPRAVASRVHAMPEGSVRLATEDDATKIGLSSHVSPRKFTMFGLASADDWMMKPSNPDASLNGPTGGLAKKLTIPCATFLLLLRSVAYCASSDQAKPKMNGVHFEWTPETLRTTTTDGHRVARLTKPWAGSSTGNALLSLESVSIIRKILEAAIREGKTDVDLTVTARSIDVKVGDIEFTSQLVSEEFPQVDSVIPQKWHTLITVNRLRFAEAVKAAYVADNSRVGVVMKLTPAKTLLCTTESPEDGVSADEFEPLDIQHRSKSGSEIIIRLNGSYVRQTIDSFDDEDLVLNMSGPRDPILIVPKDQIGLESEKVTTFAIIMCIQL